MKHLRVWSVVLSSIAATALLSGCASTRIASEWQKPQISDAPFQNIFVAAITKQESTRRLFEDSFASQMNTLGVKGVQAYQYIKDTGEVTKETVLKALAEAGADAAVAVRLVRIDTEMQAVGSAYSPVGGGFHGYYNAAWSGFYDPVTIYQYDVIVLEVKLFDVKTEEMVWSITTETLEPGDLKREVESYAKLVAERLRKAKLI